MQYLHPHIKRNEITPLIVFSFFIALSVVLSNHIQITGNPYSGLTTQNYITPYRLSDIGVLVAAFTVVLLCCLALYQITCKAITAKSAGNNTNHSQQSPSQRAPPSCSHCTCPTCSRTTPVSCSATRSAPLAKHWDNCRAQIISPLHTQRSSEHALHSHIRSGCPPQRDALSTASCKLL